MDEVGVQEKRPYQWLLRVVGAYLDAEQARGVLVLETSDSFVVRFRRDDHPDSLVCVHLALADLLNRKALHEAKRQRRPTQAAQTSTPHYEDAFRALGYELEDVPAFSIALDELDDGFVMTYQADDVGGGYLARKLMAEVDQRKLAGFLRQAHARRQAPETLAGMLGRFRSALKKR